MPDTLESTTLHIAPAVPDMVAVVDAARVLRRVGLLAPTRYSSQVEIMAVDGLRIALGLFDAALPLNRPNAGFNESRRDK